VTALLPLRILTLVALLGFAPFALAQDAVKFSEKFDGSAPYRVELKVTMTGKLVLPGGKDQPSTTVALDGSSTVSYDERPLATDEPKTEKVIRAYRSIEFKRTLGDKEQVATIREPVRRMVVLRTEKGKKAPFSPDGPLLWSEIDVVKHDLFAPVLVAGLLPAGEVKPGAKWTAGPGAIAELTDLETVEEGGFAVEFISVVTLNNRKLAKLGLTGSVKGTSEDGPTRQKIDGTAYFDLEAARLTYLKVNGVHEMLGSDGKAIGRVDGTFTMTRSESKQFDDIGDAQLAGKDLKPTAENSLLLYDNADLGLKFLYPRRWRVGVLQGRQLTLEEPKGGGILLTVEAVNRLPTVEKYQDEVKAFLAKQQAKIAPLTAPIRTPDKPNRIDRFSVDAEMKTGKARLEYAITQGSNGGVMLAARLPAEEAADLKADLDRILKSLEVTKAIGEK
jgi:hypothetical protein